MARRRSSAGYWLVVTALLCATIVAGIMFLERQMIYYPTRYPEGFWNVAAVTRSSGCTLEDCFFSAADGVRLHGWWCRPSHADGVTADTVLLWFHGNAGNLSDRADLMLRLAGTPAQIFIVDYRGYGRSEGAPSESGLYLDGEAAWRYLSDERRIAAGRIVLLGDSLGSAVAVDLATRVQAAGLIVQSGFTSIPDMAAQHFPFVPRFLIRTKMDSLAKIERVSEPKLFIHSPDDEVVPYGLGRRLFEAAPEPKWFVDIPGATHNDTDAVGGYRYFDAIRGFLVTCWERGEGRVKR